MQVVDRLNHQGKGVVEFLDYLTYVPLFVEIHDSISDWTSQVNKFLSDICELD